MNNQNFSKIIMKSEEKHKSYLTNSQKKLNSSSKNLSNFTQTNFKTKHFEEDEKKNLNELSAKNNLLQNNQKNPSIFNM